MTNITCSGDIYKLPEVNCSNGVLNYYSLYGNRYVDSNNRVIEMAQQYKCLEIDNLGACTTHTVYSSLKYTDFCFFDASKDVKYDYASCDVECLDTLDISCSNTKVIKSLKYIMGNFRNVKVEDGIPYISSNLGIEFICCEVEVAVVYNVAKLDTKLHGCLVNFDYIFEGYERSAIQKIKFDWEKSGDSVFDLEKNKINGDYVVLR